MELKKASFKDIAGSRYCSTNGFGSAQAVARRFANSDMDIALVENPNWGAKTCGASVLNNAIKRLKLAGVRAIQHDGKTYLVKTDKADA